ncbi:hypothetical protein [Hymenobacter canadensis]|uniref:Outer membrane protein beta-barrel domain-containing protein n=1 Tax=Hymenobacter canadensis TaxID=2999067 RepID=A0ABY7LND8_9BACT|nr:hypothetical protein [Hymenobacter canadensis]WBA41366.1 hypothetical protein O3303_16290 [Hymenobacter canadensis]
MNTIPTFRQFFYKRALLLLAASGVAFTAAAQHQYLETANPSAISAHQLRQLLVGSADGVDLTASVLASNDSTRATSPRYEQSADAPVRPAHTSTLAPVANPTAAGRNVLRVDLANMVFENAVNFELLQSKPWALPLLLSYERQLGKRTSVGLEALLNGGNSEQRRGGGGLQLRYYAVPSRRVSPLAGFYVAPTVSYRKIGFQDERILAGKPYATVRAAGAGVYGGWQAGTRPNAHGRRLILDVAVGAMHWMPTSTTFNGEAAMPNTYEYRWTRARTALDARIGLGVQF